MIIAKTQLTKNFAERPAQQPFDLLISNASVSNIVEIAIESSFPRKIIEKGGTA
jgi:hypothetical protein